MKTFLIFLAALSLYGEQKSTTGSSTPYREVCKRAVIDPLIFQTFRSLNSYFYSVECGQAGEFAAYLEKHAKARTLFLMPQFRKLELYGNPVTHPIPRFGSFSGTTLRYIVVADQISRLFDLPKNYTVAEIGAGFGGQAYILFTLHPFSQYYIYDLPEVEPLVEKMLSLLSLPPPTSLDVYAKLPTESVDLFISNYALSECDRETQLDYLKRVAFKAKRGYMLWNDTNLYEHLTVSDLVALFATQDIPLKIHPEPVFSYTGNVLITWDTSK